MNIEIANRLVQLRKKSNLSQEELAAKIGISRQAVSKWERAEASPDTDNLIMLSRVYGISLDDLLKTDEKVDGESDGVKEDEAPPIQVLVRGKPIHINKNGFSIHIGDDDDDGDNDDDDDDDDDDDGCDEDCNVKCEENADGYNVHISHTPRHKNFWQEFPFSVFVVIAYLGLGFGFGLWHPGWIIFFLIPIYHCCVDWFCGKRKKSFFEAFPLPVFLAGLYIFIGCVWGMWHPYWAMFLLIPIYYPLVHALYRPKRQKRVITVKNDKSEE